MIATPAKPTMVALQRLMPTVSCRTSIAKTVTKKLLAKLIAAASASGRWTTAVKPDSIATNQNLPDEDNLHYRQVRSRQFD